MILEKLWQVKFSNFLEKKTNSQYLRKQIPFLSFSPNNEILCGKGGIADIFKISDDMNFSPCTPLERKIIVRFSSLYASKLEEIIQNDFQDTQDINQARASKIRIILEEEQFKLNQEEYEEENNFSVKQLLLTWIYIEMFQVYRFKFHYIVQNLRSLFSKYALFPNLKEYDIYSLTNFENYKSNDIIDIVFKRINVCLKICDFSELSNIFTLLGQKFKDYNAFRVRFPNSYIDFSNICYAFTQYFAHLNYMVDEIKLTENDLVQLHSVKKENLFKIKNAIDSLCQGEDVLQPEEETFLERFITLFSLVEGNTYEINKIAENHHEYILMAFYFNVISEFNYDCFEDQWFQMNKDPLTNLQKSCLIENCSEFYKRCKQALPGWFVYYIVDIFFDLELIFTENINSKENVLEIELNNFIEFLISNDFPLKIVFIFLKLTPNSSEDTYNIWENIVDRHFNKMLDSLLKKEKIFENKQHIESEIYKYMHSVEKELYEFQLTDLMTLTCQSMCRLAARKLFESDYFDKALNLLNQYKLHNLVKQYVKRLSNEIFLRNDISKRFECLANISDQLKEKFPKLAYIVELHGFVSIKNTSEISSYVANLFKRSFLEGWCPKILFLFVYDLFMSMDTYLLKEIKREEFEAAQINFRKIEDKLKYKIENLESTNVETTKRDLFLSNSFQNHFKNGIADSSKLKQNKYESAMSKIKEFLFNNYNTTY